MQTDHHAPRPSCCIDIVGLLGGAESIALVDMLVAMYSLWAARRNLTCERLLPLRLEGNSAMGFAKLEIVGADPDRLAGTENGIHRLIRTPPGQIRRRIALAAVRVSDFNRTPLPITREGWGGVIRSLIIDPHQAIKNHRTGFICPDIVAIFAGDLERFWEERPSPTVEPRHRPCREPGRVPLRLVGPAG